ncbi:hypothetical protein [Nocardia yamanashiensis]|nr:hypothetical protein [Nocardia yamanashiensis]
MAVEPVPGAGNSPYAEWASGEFRRDRDAVAAMSSLSGTVGMARA